MLSSCDHVEYELSSHYHGVTECRFCRNRFHHPGDHNGVVLISDCGTLVVLSAIGSAVPIRDVSDRQYPDIVGTQTALV